MTNAWESGTGTHNLLVNNPMVVSQYCNGSRVPPELASMGYHVPPGTSDATGPNPIFNLTPAATVDEGNNWVNMAWGPLSLSNPVTATPTTFVPLGNYSPTAGSPVINYIPGTTGAAENAPSTDFFGNPRPDPASTAIDIGAVELQTTGGGGGGGTTPTLTSIAPSSGTRGTSVGVTLTGTNLTGTSTVTVSRGGLTCSGVTNVSATTVTATCTITTTAAPTARKVTVTTQRTASNAITSALTVTAPTLTSIA